jgi:transposase
MSIVRVYVGLDYHQDTVRVCVLDEEGSALLNKDFPNCVETVAEGIWDCGVPACCAIEACCGAADFAEELQEKYGWEVKLAHPGYVRRLKQSPDKSDASDAYLLADLLRTDGHRWRALTQQSDAIRALRALVRSRDDLVAARVAAANQLTSTLQAFWPGAACIFADVASPIGLAFLRRYPSPRTARRLSEAQLQRFCKHQHYSGRRSPADLLGRLRAAATGRVGVQTEQAMAKVGRAQVAVLVPLVTQIAELTRRIEQFMHSLPDGLLMMSFPRAGQVCAAQILAELGDVRERFPNADLLAAEAGAVPVTYQSGKTRSVAFRWACNHRLRQAVTCLADNSRHASDWARAVYTAARARGCDHTHAIRILARAWLRVIWRAWIDRKPYDPALHGASNRLAAARGG